MNNAKLFNRNFTIIIVGQLISMLGNSIQRFAFSLYILELTGSATMFSTILSIELIPTIILSPFGGAIADRISKKKIMVGLDFCCYIIIGFFAFFIYGKSYQVIFIAILMFVLSLINSIYSPAVEAGIPEVVSDEHFNAANSIVTQISSITSLIGPIAAGFLYGILGVKAIMIINMVSYFVSAVMELFLKMPYEKKQDEKLSLSIYINDVKDGFKYLYKEQKRILKVIFIISGINLFISPLYFVGVPYVVKIVFGVSDQLYGISEGALGLGMILGAILINFVDKYISFEKNYIHFIALALVIFLMGACTSNVVLNLDTNHIIAFIIFTLTGFVSFNFIAFINIQFMTYIQFNVPKQILGKTIGLSTGISTVLIPVGQVIYGLLYDKLANMLFLLYFVSGTITLLCAKYLYDLFQDRLTSNEQILIKDN